jgi:positive regulator of sigma E activity
MESKGVVLRIEGDLAVVGVKRLSACDSCRAKCGGHCDKAQTVEAKVKNSLNAKCGDSVVLHTKTSTVMGYALAVFILPIILAVIGYLLPTLFNFKNLSIISAIFFFFLSFFIIFLIWGKKDASEKITMIRIEESNND